MTPQTKRSARIVAFVLAGGEGRRLKPLTADRDTALDLATMGGRIFVSGDEAYQGELR